MEIRASAPNAPYVKTGIPKVAETPLEGSEASDPQTFGPFQTDSATMMKTPNSKGYSVRFEGGWKEETRADPIEQAFDSIFLFIDDVREAGSTVRGEGGNGCMSAMVDKMDVSQTFEHVTEGLCRNPCSDPCTESFGQMQPPVDLMLDVQSPYSTDKREAPEDERSAPAFATKTIEKMDYAVMSKENSVRDMSVSIAEEKALESNGAGPNYSPVETISDKMRTLIPEETLQLVMDAFIIKTGEVKPNAAELAVKNSVDSDPIVEAIDRLIIFFDDIQEALMGQKEEHLTRKMTMDLQASLIEKRDSITKIDQPAAESEYDKSDNTTVSQDTMKTANFVPLRPASLQMAPEEYAEAVASAAEYLTQTFPAEDLSSFTKEELHRQALERIMSEHPELEEGFSDHKTEAEILEELMKDAENAIRDSRCKDQSPKEKLVVLGHSGTLTPIPEVDEASAGTPASDLIEHGVLKGTIPQVPLLPMVPIESEPAKEHVKPQLQERIKVCEEQVSPKAKTPIPSNPVRGAAEEEVIPAKASVSSQGPKTSQPVKKPLESAPAAAETDPIVYAIDRIFIFFDDLQEQKACEGCLGASVPSDIADGDEIVEDEGAAEENIIEARISELKKPIDSRGQKMLEEALRLVREAKDADDALVAIKSTDMNDRSALPTAATELIEKLGAAFDEAREQMEPQGKKIFARGIPMDDNEKNRAIAKLVEAAFEESDKLRRALNSAVDHPGLKGKGVGAPQTLVMSNDRQNKVEFEIPELMKHSQDPYVAWEGDDSELMASINADRKLSEMEHENIFRDVSKGLQESAGGIITRADNPIFSIYKAPAFTEGNSGSAELPEDRLEDPARSALKVLCGESECRTEEVKGQADIVTSHSSDALRARDLGLAFPGWSMSKARGDKLRSKNSM